MFIIAYLILAIIGALCMRAAQRMAVGRGRKPVPWMWAAAIFGPLPLIPLALMQKAHV